MAVPKVLVVEDDTAIRTLVLAALKREPIEVHTAMDGLAALECARVHAYAVILLDLMMPRLDGYEFLEVLDAIPGAAAPVIIVMTAFDTTSLRKLPPNRVHAVLHKPFDVERVVEIVRDCAFVRREAANADESRITLPRLTASERGGDVPVC